MIDLELVLSVKAAAEESLRVATEARRQTVEAIAQRDAAIQIANMLIDVIRKGPDGALHEAQLYELELRLTLRPPIP